jgi:hypothetical protein
LIGTTSQGEPLSMLSDGIQSSSGQKNTQENIGQIRNKWMESTSRWNSVGW